MWYEERSGTRRGLFVGFEKRLKSGIVKIGMEGEPLFVARSRGLVGGLVEELVEGVVRGKKCFKKN